MKKIQKYGLVKLVVNDFIPPTRPLVGVTITLKYWWTVHPVRFSSLSYVPIGGNLLIIRCTTYVRDFFFFLFLSLALSFIGEASSVKLAPLLAIMVSFAAISSVCGMVALCILRSHMHSNSPTRYVNANGSLGEKTNCISKLEGYEVKSTPDVIQCNNKGKSDSASLRMFLFSV